MPFASQKANLTLSPETKNELLMMSRSRTEPAQKVERAKILLAYEAGKPISGIARDFKTNRPKVERAINKALEFGAAGALSDLPGRGKPPKITPEARTWLLSLACQKPKELGYASDPSSTVVLAGQI